MDLVEIESPAVGDTKRLHIFFPAFNLAAHHAVGTWRRSDDASFLITRYTDDTDMFDPFGRPLAKPRSPARAAGVRIDGQTRRTLPGHAVAARSTPTRTMPKSISTLAPQSITSYEIVNTAGKTVAGLAALNDSSADLKVHRTGA